MEKKYSKSHEWVKQDGELYTIGITYHAAKELGDIVYVEKPFVGDKIDMDKSFGVVESVKSVSDLIAPISGEVVEVNENLEDKPELINQDAESVGWIMKIKITETKDLDTLITKAEYDKFVEAE